MTRIFSPEQDLVYGDTRLTSANVPPSIIRKIELHNGELENEVKARNGGDSLVVVNQKDGRETLFYRRSDGTLFIPQFSGLSRETRYSEMGESYRKATCDLRGRTIDFVVIYPDNNPTNAFRRYSLLPYLHVVGSFVRTPEYEKNRVFECVDVQNIDTIVFGNVDAFAKQAKVVEKGNSAYIRSQIVDVDGKLVWNINDLYGDQACNIMRAILWEYFVLARESGKKRTIKPNVFGRAGGLLKSMNRHDLFFPNGVVNQTDVRQRNNHHLYPLKNGFAKPERKDLVFNVYSIVNETVEELDDAVKHGCKAVEMELFHFMLAIAEAEGLYHDFLDIKPNFVYYFSDLPIKVRNGVRDNVAKELDSDKGEQEAVGVILDKIESE
jgi:hypothetical protein